MDSALARWGLVIVLEVARRSPLPPPRCEGGADRSRSARRTAGGTIGMVRFVGSEPQSQPQGSIFS